MKLSDFEAASPDVEYAGYLLPASYGTKTISRSASLFGTGDGQLPVDTKIDNIHPVTLLCLLEILSQRGRIRVNHEWSRLSFHTKPSPPVAWGFLAAKDLGKVALGDEVRAMVVDDDYGYDASLRVELQLKIDGGAPVRVVETSYQKNGFVLHPLRIDFWGNCCLVVAGAASDKPAQVISTTALTIAAPQFAAPSESDQRLGLYKPFETRTHWVLPVKLKQTNPLPSEVGGVVGIELCDPSGTWSDAQITVGDARQRLFIPAVARGTLIEDGNLLDTSKVIVRDGFIGSATTATLLSGKPVVFAPGVTHEALRLAQEKVPVAASLLNAVQRLRSKLGAASYVTVKELGRDGKRCVLSCPKAAYRLAQLASADASFSDVRLPGSQGHDGKLQNMPDTATDKALVKQLTALGVELEVRGLETLDTLLGQPDCQLKRHGTKGRELNPTSLLMSGDGLFVTAIDPKKEAKTKGYVTDNFTLTDFTSASALSVSALLVRGLCELLQQVKCSIGHIAASGTSCTVAGKGAAEAARNVPYFAHVDDAPSGGPNSSTATLSVADRGTLFATFDPQGALDELFADIAKQNGSPDRTPYRFYFRAINAFSLVAPRANAMENTRRYVLEREMPALTAAPTPSLVFRGTPEGEDCGSLRKLAFEDLQFSLVENQVHVACQLRGNRTAWAPFHVRITHQTGSDNPPSRTVLVDHGDQRVTASFEIPADARRDQFFKVEAELRANPDALEHTQPAPLQTPCPFEPSLGKLSIDPFGSFLMVRAQTRGLQAPSQNRSVPDGSAPLTAKQVASLSAVPWSTRGTALHLEITLGGRPCPMRVDYLLPTKNDKGQLYGLINHEGTFCAFVSMLGIKKGEEYDFRLKREGNVRGAPLSAVETKYTHEA